MKFEEALQLMRDKGKIGLFKGCEYSFNKEGIFIVHSSFGENENVFRNVFPNPDLYFNDNCLHGEWQIKNEYVWSWIFGFGIDWQMIHLIHYPKMSESEAEDYMMKNNFGWAEKIEHTRENR